MVVWQHIHRSHSSEFPSMKKMSWQVPKPSLNRELIQLAIKSGIVPSHVLIVVSGYEVDVKVACMHKCFWVYLRQKWQISQLNFYLLLVYIPHGQNSRNIANCSFVLNFDFIGKFSLVLYLQSNRKRKFILWPWAVCLNVYLTLHFLFIDLVSSRWFWYHSSVMIVVMVQC